MVCVGFIQQEYPLHWLVWNNEYKILEAELAKKEVRKRFFESHSVEILMKLNWVASFHDSRRDFVIFSRVL